MFRLATFLGSIFSSLFGFVAAWLGARTALVVTIATVSLALTAGLFLAIKALVVGLVTAVPYEPFLMGFFSIWPSNAETCIAACFGADIAVFLYRYKVGVIESLAK